MCALLLKVRPKGGGRLAPLLFNQVQRRIWAEMCKLIAAGKPLFLVILKFRQAGMSTFWCAWIFWHMWRQKDIQSMIVAHQLATAETMIENMRVFFDEMPAVFQPQLRDGNHGASIPRGELYFADRRAWCLIHVAKNVDPRGQQVTHVLETEFASYPEALELNNALLPQLPARNSPEFLTCSFAVESTPKGQNDFYDLYQLGKTGKTMWTSFFFPWFLFDEQYSQELPPEGYKLSKEERELQKWYSKQRMEVYGEDVGVSLEQMYWRALTIEEQCNGDVEKFNQEYPADDEEAFIIGSKSVFKEEGRYIHESVRKADTMATEAWQKYKWKGEVVRTKGPVRCMLRFDREDLGATMKITNPRLEPHGHGNWLIWEPVVAGDQYVGGADPSLGIDEDGDNGAMCFVNVSTGWQVAEYVGHTPPEAFADEFAAACYYYNQALAVPEVNNVGYIVLNRMLAKILYPNMYRWPKWDEARKYTAKRGFETNHRTKMLMVSSMKEYLREEQIGVASRGLLSELSTFEQTGDDEYQAQKGRNDDRVMAFGLCLMGIDQTPRLLQELSRGLGRLPTARELGLATMDNPEPHGAIPAKILERLNIVQRIPWNPISEESFF